MNIYSIPFAYTFLSMGILCIVKIGEM